MFTREEVSQAKLYCWYCNLGKEKKEKVSSEHYMMQRGLLYVYKIPFYLNPIHKEAVKKIAENIFLKKGSICNQDKENYESIIKYFRGLKKEIERTL